MEFHRPEVPLSLIVCRSYVEVVHEAQDRLAVGVEGGDEVERLALEGAALAPGAGIGVDGQPSATRAS